MNHNKNITRIKAVHNALGDLKNDVVFVGGAVASLYAKREWDEVRETDDVDILVEVYTHPQYAQLEEKLRSIGFVNDIESKFVGRYKLPGVIVDVMGLDEKILGFANRWYKDAFYHSMNHIIDDQNTVRIFTAPYFLASKLEAFKNRGKNQAGEYDGRTSDDFHDIVFLLVYRDTIWDEIEALPESALKSFILNEFSTLLKNPYLEEWIDAHASYHSPVSYYIVIPGIKKLLR
jgi:hypothetical protein